MTINLSLLAAGMRLGGESKWFAASDVRMALADRMTGKESPEELMLIGQLDKTLTLIEEQGKIEYEYAWHQEQQALRMQQKDRARRKRMFDIGAIFTS